MNVLISYGLRYLSYLYGFLSRCLFYFFKWGWRKQYRLSVPVVSIGNITVGGTGKTPVVLQILKEVEQVDICIVSRGYKALIKVTDPIVISDRFGLKSGVDVCGDEPYLIASRFPHLLSIVAQKKWKGAVLGEALGSKCIFIDDGMQHRRLYRDINVVVIHAQIPLWKEGYLPYGKLREPLIALEDADCLILNHVRDAQEVEMWKQYLPVLSKKPWVATRVMVERVVNLQSGLTQTLYQKKIMVFCALGSPLSFVETLSQLGAIIVDSYFLADHEVLNKEQKRQLLKRSRDLGVEMIVMTEKDRVKYSLDDFEDVCAVYVEIGLQIIEGEQVWADLIERIKSLIHPR